MRAAIKYLLIAGLLVRMVRGIRDIDARSAIEAGVGLVVLAGLVALAYRIEKMRAQAASLQQQLAERDAALIAASRQADAPEPCFTITEPAPYCPGPGCPRCGGQTLDVPADVVEHGLFRMRCRACGCEWNERAS